MKNGTKSAARRAIRMERDANRLYAMQEKTVDDCAERIAPVKVGDVFTVRDRAHRLMRYKVSSIHGALDRITPTIRWRVTAHRVTKDGGYRGGERRFGANEWAVMLAAAGENK